MGAVVVRTPWEEATQSCLSQSRLKI